jgi:autotransporter-associated beta strand protein
MTGGTLARTPGDHQSNFIAGDGQNSYGYFNVSGGSLSNVRFQLGGTQDPRVGTGIGRVTGGELAISSWILIGRQTNSVGVLTLDGGTFNHINASQNVALGYGGGRGELNITGGTLNSSGRSVSTAQYNAYAATGIVNLCAGTLAVNSITNLPSLGVAVVNFSGGTLKACVNTPLFLTTNVTASLVNGPFGAYAGGAVIDTDGKNVTVSARLRAPTGNGVASIALTSQGAGYIGEPYVSIQGGDGMGATAVANMEEDGSGTYRVASVTVTAPGWDYSSAPSVSFSGGGTTNQAAATVALAPNTSGGLTKLGAGTLTLAGVNTYSGMTTVSGGTLKLGIADALPPDAPVSLAGGIFDLGGFTVTNSGLTALSGALTNGTLQTVLSPAGAGALGTQALALMGATLKGTYLADVSADGGSDLVAVTGNIDLSGLTLQIVEPGLLKRHQQYTLLVGAGARVGMMTATNLPDSRWHLVNLADGTVKLIFVEGTLIKVR